MTITRAVSHLPLSRSWLIAMLALLPVTGVVARQSMPQPAIKPVPVAIAPPPGVQFQQTVQQQQLRDQVQESQLQQQLHQSVSDNAKRPGANDQHLQRQLDQADRAQADRDRAEQQARLDRHRGQAALPRVIPQSLPAASRSGG